MDEPKQETMQHLKWQKTPPKEAGFYFYRNIFGCVQVLNIWHGMIPIKCKEGEWAGPIPMPVGEEEQGV